MDTQNQIPRIRDAREADATLLAHHNVMLAAESEGTRLNPAVALRGVRRALAAPALARYLVAEVGETVIAQLMLNYELTDWRDGIVWWIHSVYVDPAWRGRGVFGQMFRHVEALAKAAGDVRNLRLYVDTDNTRGIGVYEKLGMTREKYFIYDKPV